MRFGRGSFDGWSNAMRREWLISNGAGGFAMGTAGGGNTRRYHGLLVASLAPPVARHLLVSALHESVQTARREYALGSARTQDYELSGYQWLTSFRWDTHPVWNWRMEDVSITRQVVMVRGENTTVVYYQAKTGKQAADVRISPLINSRDYHSDSRAHQLGFRREPCVSGWKLSPEHMGGQLTLSILSGEMTTEDLHGIYYYGMHYTAEAERGLGADEDHMIPGVMHLHIPAESEASWTITLSAEPDCRPRDGAQEVGRWMAYHQDLREASGFCHPALQQLVSAADAFIVDRPSIRGKTILAGYPWFTDWGRDTMIALPGLTLATGRTEDARLILRSFAQFEKDGLIPNLFPDAGTEPVYNTVDAPLWYFEAVWKTWTATGDKAFLAALYPVLQRIAERFTEGMDKFSIYLDSRGLLCAGTAETQLTWMDAKVGSWVVTPRHGQAVELNALWYNALRVLEAAGAALGYADAGFGARADQLEAIFTGTFWNDAGDCLYDVIGPDGPDCAIRPNQVMAASLTFPVLTGDKARRMVDTVRQYLLSDVGMRTLQAEHPAYRGWYGGDVWSRDGAYHQGTVWTWPLGHFITAWCRTHPEDMEQAREFVLPVFDHLWDACLGSVSEIFDAEPPHTPRGCPAQAWSVAEILRVCREEKLFD